MLFLMNKKILQIIILCVVLVSLGLVWWLGNSMWQRHYAEKQAAMMEAALEAEQAQQVALVKEFEEFLNAFLADIQSKATAYKNESKVLHEIITPRNLTKPEYILENYTLLQKTIPALHGKMDEIILAFEQADQRANLLLAQIKGESQSRLIEQWEAMNSNYVRDYIDFFATEEKVISAHHDLMTLYQQNASSIGYNVKTEELTFKDPALAAEIKAARQRIKDLSVQQARDLVE